MTWGLIVQSAHVLLVICQDYAESRTRDPEMKKNARTTRFEHLMLSNYRPATLISWKIAELPPPQCSFGSAFAHMHMLVKHL